MATLEQLHDALIKADAAGNVDDARAFAAEIQKMRSVQPESPSMMQSIKQGAGNLVAGAVRGAGSIGATLLAPFDIAEDALAGKGLSMERNNARRAGIDAGLQSMGAEPDSMMYKGGKLLTEIGGTMGVGGGMANVASKVPMLAKSPALISALQSGGMSAGGATGKAAIAARLAGGSAVGGASAGLVNPEDAGYGALVGGAAPYIIQGAGRLGSGVRNLVSTPKQGQLLVDALGVNADEAARLAAALRQAPESIVPNSKLTTSQALQLQKANTPAVKMLERTVAGGRSGDPLLQAYENQAGARIASLVDNGAEVYQGAAREEAINTGNKLGAILRTQSDDAQSVNRALWSNLDQQAINEGTSIALPYGELEAAMSPLGKGSVISGNDARKVLSTAKDYGVDTITPTKAPTKQQQNLEQFIRSQGGMRSDKRLTGESRALSNKQTGTTGLINNKTGQDVQRLADSAFERGFISEPDSGVLIEALQGRAGLNTFADDAADIEQRWMAMRDASMGDVPDVLPMTKAVPFAEAQRLRSGIGSLADKANNRDNKIEGAVLSKMQDAIANRFDDAASGNLAKGESISPEFMRNYQAARDATRQWHQTYDGGNAISQILRKPYSREYALTGDEVTNKLWHGGAGLDADIRVLKGALSENNYEPSMNQLRKYIMTDAASKTNASGQYGAALPKYVENRIGGLQEALKPNQYNALANVAKDIRNAEAAGSVAGLRGSDTQAKIDRALGAGLLDSEGVKTLSKVLSVKGFGAETLRSKASESIVKYKGDKLADLLANPRKAAEALSDTKFIKQADSETIKLLKQAVLKASVISVND